MYEYWRIYGFKVGLLGLYYYELLQYAISSVLAMKVIRSRYMPVLMIPSVDVGQIELGRRSGSTPFH
jgi:hypothetical protein